MIKFEFELTPVADIAPWGNVESPSLHWFALSHGLFRIVVGDEVLFRYTEEITAHLGGTTRDTDYFIAALARDILGSFAPAVAKLPAPIERLASDWALLERLEAAADGSDADHDDAWRWLWERSPVTGYLAAAPRFQMVRIGDDVHIHWDNRWQLIDDQPAWTAQHGAHVVPLASFRAECRGFVTRLLDAMEDRLAGLADGRLRPQVPVDLSALREQHATWRDELEGYFAERAPEVPWDRTERALRALAERHGLPLHV